MSRPDDGTGRDTAIGRRRLLLAAAALVLAALVALVLVLTSGDDDAGDRPGAQSTAAPTAAPEDEPSLDGPEIPAPPVESAPAGQTAPASERPPNLPAVALDAPAETGDGVTGSLVSVEAVDGTGVGRGNIAGPALRVTVRLTNGTAEAVALDGVAVELTHGADAVPASPLDDPSRAPFDGSLAPGATAEGVYVFSVPADDRRIVSVSVGYRAGAPFLVFSGSAP